MGFSIIDRTSNRHTTYDTIESIMEQTMKANRIILWLDYSFEKQPLPKALQLLQKRGLEIEYCKDIRSYKKLIPALKKSLFPLQIYVFPHFSTTFLPPQVCSVMFISRQSSE